jgi:hypothetical protein
MRVNLGTVDAKAHGLDADKCQAGMEANVSSEAGTWLVEHGHAEPLDVKGVAKPAEIQAPRKRTKSEDD